MEGIEAVDDAEMTGAYPDASEVAAKVGQVRCHYNTRTFRIQESIRFNNEYTQPDG
jgi:hypothetical protein